ncbi:hypothetical protein QR680_008188 [Steinernema hermaphroditum]|uniref:Uncharacterized protein n=1 Tax=Steinernema hermaphroditum TaxID=289476 RepID=A0AA39M781_9BILA|nr:hypothetical protein QR680_008188 [Steinernema hermaphroditum]
MSKQPQILGDEFAVTKHSFLSFNYVYLQYCLSTGLYMLEPWERGLFNTFVIASVAVGASLAFLFLPQLFVIFA